jgi:hypothetical protein
MTTRTEQHIEKVFLTPSEDLWSAAIGIEAHDVAIDDRHLLGIEASLSLGDGEDTALLDLSVWLEPEFDPELKGFNRRVEENVAALEAVEGLIRSLKARYLDAVLDIREEVAGL